MCYIKAGPQGFNVSTYYDKWSYVAKDTTPTVLPGCTAHVFQHNKTVPPNPPVLHQDPTTCKTLIQCSDEFYAKLKQSYGQINQFEDVYFRVMKSIEVTQITSIQGKDKWQVDPVTNYTFFDYQHNFTHKIEGDAPYAIVAPSRVNYDAHEDNNKTELGMRIRCFVWEMDETYVKIRMYDYGNRIANDTTGFDDETCNLFLFPTPKVFTPPPLEEHPNCTDCGLPDHPNCGYRDCPTCTYCGTQSKPICNSGDCILSCSWCRNDERA